MTTATGFFHFGADNETVRACLSLIERAVSGQTHAQKMCRQSVKFAGNRTYSTRKPKRRA